MPSGRKNHGSGVSVAWKMSTNASVLSAVGTMYGSSTLARMIVAEREDLVHDQRQGQAEHQFEDRRREGVDERVPDGLEKDRALRQVDVVLQPDKVAQTDDADVAHAVPDADDERVGDEDDEQQQRRGHQHVADDPFAVEPAFSVRASALAADRTLRGRGRDRHCLADGVSTMPTAVRTAIRRAKSCAFRTDGDTEQTEAGASQKSASSPSQLA